MIKTIFIFYYQGANIWHKCYHGSHYPATTFVHLDDIDETARTSGQSATVKESSFHNSSDYSSSSPITTKHQSTPIQSKSPDTTFMDLPSLNVGDNSHIPRLPPTPQTYTIPSVATNEQNQLFGMISLKENDVCYTSGTIEWVGKKRNFPINSGFKILHGSTNSRLDEPIHKKAKVQTLTQTMPYKTSSGKECDCADVLPTVSAIVDHLNALHEAVDIVDLRLNNLEDVISEHDK